MLWKVASHAGTRFTLPVQANVLGIYYNKRMFAEAGITRLPSTWDELVDVARRLTQDHTGDGTPDQYGLLLPMGSREWTVWTWQTFLWQAGGDFVHRTTMEPAFNSAAGVEALRYWIDLIHTHEAALLSAPDQGWDVQPFVDERVAMQISGPWELPYLSEIDTLDYGVFPLPRHRQRATNIGGENLYLLQSTPEREQAAWMLAKYLIRPSVQRALSENGNYCPVLRTSTNADWFSEYLARHRAYRTFYEALDHGRMRPAMPRYYAISHALGKNIRAALLQDMSPKSALQAAARQARFILQSPDTSLRAAHTPAFAR